MACRELGYPGVSQVTVASEYGTTASNYRLEAIMCLVCRSGFENLGQIKVKFLNCLILIALLFLHISLYNFNPSHSKRIHRKN